MNVVKVVSVTASVLSIGGSILGYWVDAKKFDEKVNDAVKKAIADLAKKES